EKTKTLNIFIYLMGINKKKENKKWQNLWKIKSLRVSMIVKISIPGFQKTVQLIILSWNWKKSI
ncbi:hypothetical protein, partial [Methanobacterium formicicum]|uniref:hypothetical protein n=1 Tax=Methanobacterium formicicum TaxID=2162 RepID=UPI0024489D3A